MRQWLLQTLILGFAFEIAGCASLDQSPLPVTGSGGSGTATAGGSNTRISGSTSTATVGGSDTRASGGTRATGNSGVTTGGAPATNATGGVTATGGSSLNNGGGTGISTGGTRATGERSSSSGGTTGVLVGGTSATGGRSPSSGGGTGVLAGGATAAGGRSPASAGNTGALTGGTRANGGRGPGSGGTTALGGAAGSSPTGSAGDAAICPPSTPRTGGKQYCGTSADGTADGNYTYNLWSDGKGTGCITVFGVDATFKASWTDVGDWIGRVGLSFDKTKTYDQIGTFSSDFAYTMTGITSGGFGNIGIYGWTVNPLHEFYIAENWLGKKPNFTKVGSFTIEGEGTYDIMTNQQKNAANITGTNQDFVQFWSVPQSPRQCGHISISKHFAQWASLGLQLGKMEEVRILVEGQNNSGTIEFTTATVVVTK